MAKELTCHVLLLLLLRLLLLLSPAVSFNVRTRVRERECSSVFLRSTRRYRRRRRHHQLALERDGKRGGGEERAELSTLYRRLPSCQKLVCVCVCLFLFLFSFFFLPNRCRLSSSLKHTIPSDCRDHSSAGTNDIIAH